MKGVRSMSTSNIQKFNLSQDEIINNILPQFNCKNASIEQIKIKNTDKQRAVYKVTALDNSVYCLKKVYYNETTLLFIYSVVEWLYRNEIKVARFLPSKDNKRFIEYKNMLFIFTPWLEGTKFNYDNFDDVIKASKNLAKLHSVTKDFFPIDGSLMKTGYDDLYISLNKHGKQLTECYNKASTINDDFSKIFMSTYKDNMSLVNKCLNLSHNINLDNLSRSICHGDYVNKNILINNNNEICLIDFDKCCMNFSATDISYFLRRLLKRENTKWNLDITKRCLYEYNLINHLSADDIAYIFAYIIFPQKYWRLSRDYYNNINKANKYAFCNLLTKANLQCKYQLQFMTSLTSEFNL